MNKNKKIGIAGIAFFVVLILAVTFGQKQKEKELSRYTATFLDVFDTRTDIVGYSTDQEMFTEQVTLLKEKLEYYHKLYDIYNDYEGVNNIKTINDNAGVAPVEVNEDIINLLLFSKEMYYETNGQMNIAMGSVLKIWHNYRDAGINTPENAKLPPMEDLTAASVYCDIEQIVIDEAAMTVYLPDEHMSIDVGSIGKGYAVQRVAEIARELGYYNLVINCGGNVISVGPKPNDVDWIFGIQNPDLGAKNDVIARVAITDKCLVTSGDYQRYYVVDGVEYCHIIDPDTLMPPTYFSAVSIICDDSGLADALSTAVFNMPYEEGLALINSLDNAEAIWVYPDGTIKYSKNFEDYVVE